MSPTTHLLASWIVAAGATDNLRDRRLVTLAGVAPDLDGLGIIIDIANGSFARGQVYYYPEYHHWLGHGLPAALLCSAILAAFRATTLADLRPLPAGLSFAFVVRLGRVPGAGRERFLAHLLLRPHQPEPDVDLETSMGPGRLAESFIDSGVVRLGAVARRPEGRFGCGRLQPEGGRGICQRAAQMGPAGRASGQRNWTIEWARGRLRPNGYVALRAKWPGLRAGGDGRVIDTFPKRLGQPGHARLETGHDRLGSGAVSAGICGRDRDAARRDPAANSIVSHAAARPEPRGRD